MNRMRKVGSASHFVRVFSLLATLFLLLNFSSLARSLVDDYKTLERNEVTSKTMRAEAMQSGRTANGEGEHASNERVFHRASVIPQSASRNLRV